MNYEIVRPIGRGGMGEVYLARDPRLHREVALKTLRRDLAGTELEPRLREEARLLARLNHPHIVQIHDITEYEGRLALVMEHVEGQNLHIALREKRGSPGDLLRWLAEVAAALACAHGAGIAHRDLKPENVLITRDGTAKVTDFGIAAEAAGAGDRADDLLALGRLGARLLEDIPDPSPAVRHLVDRLQSRRASQRPQAEDAAEALRLAWHESQQEETAPPRDRPGRSPGLPLAALAAVLALASAAAWWLLTPDNGPQRVAVLEPRITADGALSEDQLAGLRTTVQQALRQAALEDPALELIGQAETAALAGTPRTLAAALGADEVIAPTLRCGSRGCDLAIERTDPAGAVLNRRASSLPVEAELASYNVVLQQWRLLYPERNPAEARMPAISDDGYREFLRLYRLGHERPAVPESDLLPRIEALLDSAPAFMPLYQLYAHVALNRYDDTGEPSFAEAALRALDAAPASAGDPMPLHRARLDIALELGDYAAADRELEALRARGAPDLLLQRLSGKRHSYAGDFAEAEAHFQRALDIRPTRALLYQAAVNYYHWQHFAEAEALLDRSLALYPDDHDALNVRGLIHLQAGEMARAIADFEASLALHVDPTPLSNLGLAYLLQRDYPRSREFFQQVYRQDAGSPIFLINLADAESLLGNRETADALYREVIDSQERELAFVDLRALSQAYAQLGQYERAIATLKRIGENRRGGAETHFTAALVYALAQQDIAAVVEVEQALNAGYGAIWFTLPWFDGLCASGAFALALARHGFEGHCEGRVGNIAIN